VTVSVAMTVSGDSVNAVEADVTYAVSQMKFVSAKVDTTVWGITASKSGAAGKVRIGVGSTTPRTGTVQIATVTFTALKTGSYRFGIGQTSSIISATTNTDLLNHTGAKPAPPTDQGPFPLSSVPDCLTAAPNTGGAHICKVRAAGSIASWQASIGEWIVIRAAAGENTLADCSADQASIVPTITIDGTSLPVDVTPCAFHAGAYYVDYRALSHPLPKGDHAISESLYFTTDAGAPTGTTLTFSTTLTVANKG
jgi:hypothetical protein